MEKILVLGAGMVARPLVEYLLEQGYTLTVTSPKRVRAAAMVGDHPRGTAALWSTDDPAGLDELVAAHDIVVSMLPYAYHPMVARACLAKGKSLVTTSYVSDEMAVMDAEARERGVLFLNETGLDPGIDHMSAMQIIDTVRKEGGRIETFYSLTGALPAPEAADNPFRYKFTWSPKGVILAGNNDARYLLHGREVFIPAGELFRHCHPIEFPGIGSLETYPNRDSVHYIDIYGLQGVRTLFRGTLRFPGWCRNMDYLKRLHLLSQEPLDLKGKSYAEMVSSLIRLPEGTPLRRHAARLLGLDEDDPFFDALEWLGLFSNDPIGRDQDSPFEVTSDLMIDKMMLGDHERDMIAMQHSFLAVYPGGRREVIHSRLVDYGTPATHTAVARTVALPAAIATELILRGEIRAAGVMRPVIHEIYAPVLERLAELGISLTEERTPAADGLSVLEQ